MTHVQSVAVVGRDASLWLSALAIRRALGATGVRVQAIELESRLAKVDAYAAIPSLASLHRLLGIDEQLVLQSCRGVPIAGQRFSNWAKGGTPFLVAYDDEPPRGGDLPFAQYWAKGALEGLRVPYEDFSFASACARLNRVPVHFEGQSAFSASYGYHLDACSYSELLKQIALRTGVELAGAGVGRVDVSGDSIAGIDVTDGTRVTADLYIDASGREGALIGKLETAAFEPWDKWLPLDRIIATSAPRLGQLPAFSQVSAFAAGWVGLFPLQNRTAVVAVYNSGFVSANEAVELARVVSRMPISGEAVVSELRPGMQRSPWIGNCVAVGEAAVAVDPIDAVELQVTHGSLSYLMTLFPATAGEFQEADAYNRSVRLFGSNLRDFQAAHYLLNRRFDEPMWDRARDTLLPLSLKRRVDMFSARALIPMNDEETFHEQLWTCLLLGCGIRPQGYDPRIDSISDEVHITKVQERLRSVADQARRMPTVEQILKLEQGAAAPVSG